jgi:hypothetical protein
MLMIDSACSQLDYADDLMQAMLSLFSGYYMQAISLSTQIGAISAAERLQPFNPKRGNAFESFMDDIVGKTAGLPRRLIGVNSLALEAMALEAKDDDDDKKKKEPKADGTYIDQKSFESLKEVASLCVGRMYMVELVDNGVTVKLPIAIRLGVNQMADQQMVNFFTFRSSFDLDMKERWHGYRAGRLQFWRDLVLCTDLIDKYRRAAITDKSGVTAEVLSREAGHIAASLLNENAVSLATATNLIVVSRDTMNNIEATLNGTFDNQHVRKSVFENTNLMILAIVDPHYEMVEFHHRGISRPSTLSVKSLKASNKNGGGSVEEIMRTYLLGTPPALR